MTDKLDEWMSVMDDASKKAVGEVFKRISDIPPPQVIPYLCVLACLSINFLRDEGREDKFVSEFLSAATDSLKEPAPFSYKDLRVH